MPSSEVHSQSSSSRPARSPSRRSGPRWPRAVRTRPPATATSARAVSASTPGRRGCGRGSISPCALLEDGAVKCWGYNGSGQLGQGDRFDRGDESGEMGNDLALIDLGTGRTATSIGSLYRHTCAVLDNGAVKCWGDNTWGQLGQGDTEDRGDRSRRDGRPAPPDRPRHRTHSNVDRGRLRRHVRGARQRHRQMLRGPGARPRRPSVHGDSPGEMGDNLTPVDLGTGRTAQRSPAAIAHHVCVARRRHGQVLGNKHRVSSARATCLPRRRTRRDGRQPPPHRSRHRRTATAISAGSGPCVCGARRRHGQVLGKQLRAGPLGQGDDYETAATTPARWATTFPQSISALAGPRPR